MSPAEQNAGMVQCNSAILIKDHLGWKATVSGPQSSRVMTTSRHTPFIDIMFSVAILFCVFSFGLVPTQQLNVSSPLMPSQSINVSLPLGSSGPVQRMDPLTNLQVSS